MLSLDTVKDSVSVGINQASELVGLFMSHSTYIYIHTYKNKRLKNCF